MVNPLSAQLVSRGLSRATKLFLDSGVPEVKVCFCFFTVDVGRLTVIRIKCWHFLQNNRCVQIFRGTMSTFLQLVSYHVHMSISEYDFNGERMKDDVTAQRSFELNHWMSVTRSQEKLQQNTRFGGEIGTFSTCF